MTKEPKKKTDGAPRCAETSIGAGKESGFSLIEILIALTIFSFGLLAVASMQVSSITGNGRAKRVTESTAYAMSQMETLMATPYANLAADGTYPGAPPDPQKAYTISWTIADGTVASTKVITVNVKAPDGIITSLVGVSSYLQ